MEEPPPDIHGRLPEKVGLEAVGKVIEILQAHDQQAVI
jgi:hypothetical protein